MRLRGGRRCRYGNWFRSVRFGLCSMGWEGECDLLTCFVGHAQSIGMFDVPGPLAGPFSHLLTPVEGSDGGVESGCGGGESELDVEFQARAVNDTGGELQGVEMAVDTKWMLTTDIEVVKC